MFAARYGYSLEAFYDLTLRQVYQLKKVIEVRRIEEFEQAAALHGKKLQSSPKPLGISREDRAVYDSHAQTVYERKKREYQDGIRSRTTDTN